YSIITNKMGANHLTIWTFDGIYNNYFWLVSYFFSPFLIS
ncbi:hypothetical protein NT05LI_2532a, partial [Listeria ivanovii FSL F6-596]